MHVAVPHVVRVVSGHLTGSAFFVRPAPWASSVLAPGRKLTFRAPTSSSLGLRVAGGKAHPVGQRRATADAHRPGSVMLVQAAKKPFVEA